MIRRLFSKIARRYVRLVHVRDSHYRHYRAPERAGEWNPEPIPEAHVIEGAPEARSIEFGTSGDGGMTFGSWDCTAGRFKWYYGCDELISILEGEAYVQVDGHTEHLAPGSVFYFPLGTVAEWHVPEYIRKNFVLRHPAPLLKKLTWG